MYGMVVSFTRNQRVGGKCTEGEQTASISAIEVIRRHEQFEGHFRLDVEVGDTLRRVRVADLVMQVLDDLRHAGEGGVNKVKKERGQFQKWGRSWYLL